MKKKHPEYYIRMRRGKTVLKVKVKRDSVRRTGEGKPSERERVSLKCDCC